MNLPDKTHKGWVELVRAETTYDLRFVAAKIMLGRIVSSTKHDASPENITSCVEDIYNLYAQNTDNPVAQADIVTIFGQDG